jgi:hypothetical protein
MSTLNVANISDDQSTLSNSANPSDNLNNTTTVDTKFVTNGCAKAWVRSVWSTGIVESLNCSSMTHPTTGTQVFAITNSFVGNHSTTASQVATVCERIVCVGSDSSTNSIVIMRATLDAGRSDGEVTFQTYGDLA